MRLTRLVAVAAVAAAASGRPRTAVTAADAAAAAAAAATAAGSSAPSRLSRLSRPGGPDSGPVGTALEAEAVQLPGGAVAHPKAAAAGVHPTQQQLGRAAAVDVYQQQDQGRHQPRQGSAGFMSSSEPQSPATGGAWCDLPDSSVEYQPASSSISPLAGGGMGSVQQQQQQGSQQGQAVTAGRSPGIATAAAAAGSPSAGLATLMQALDTKSTGSAPAAAASQGERVPGHLSSSCGQQQQQQAAVMMDL